MGTAASVTGIPARWASVAAASSQAARAAAGTLASTISTMRPAMSSTGSAMCADHNIARDARAAARYGSSASWRDWATRAPVESQISKSSS